MLRRDCPFVTEYDRTVSRRLRNGFPGTPFAETTSNPYIDRKPRRYDWCTDKGGTGMIDREQVAKLFEAADISDTEGDVLVFILNNLEQAPELGIRGIAQKCFTSSTTVIRLAKKLGYSGFREMMYGLQEMSARPKDNDPGAVGMTVAKGSLQSLFDVLSIKGSVCLYGEGWSRIPIDYMTKRLIINGYHVISHEYLATGTIIENTPDLICAILISKSGTTTSVVEAARRCRHASVPVFSITGNARGRLVQQSDTAFVLPDDVPFDIENRYPNLFFGRCIIAFEQIFRELLHRSGKFPDYL